MILTRRQLIGAASAIGLASLPVAAFAQQGRVRRNIFDLSERDADRVALADGLAIMRRRVDFLSLERQRSLHIDFGQHGSWRFFPWHRAQLAHFEAIIASLTGHSRFALPYWDYQQTGHLPDYFHDPRSAFHHPGRSSSEVDYADRRWGFTQAAADLFTDSFETFVGTPSAAGRVEALGHDMVHGLVGGDMGNLSRAPLDPIFYLHHCNIDRVWQTWHRRQPASWPQQWLDEPLRGYVGPRGPTGPFAVRQLLDTVDLGYDYDAPYPARWFSVSDTPPEGMSRREIISTETFRASASRSPGESDLRIALPAAVLAAMRADRDQSLLLDGSGTVAYETANLAGNVIKVAARAGAGQNVRPVTVTASAALLPLPGDAGGRAAGAHAHTASDAHRFRFGMDLVNLIGDSEGEVFLQSSIEPIAGAPVPVPARAALLDYEIRLSRTRWV